MKKKKSRCVENGHSKLEITGKIKKILTWRYPEIWLMFIKTFLNLNNFFGNYIKAIIICLPILFDILPTFYFTNSLLNQVSHVHLPSFRSIIPMRLCPNQIERTMTFLATLTVVPLVLKGRPFFPSYNY